MAYQIFSRFFSSPPSFFKQAILKNRELECEWTNSIPMIMRIKKYQRNKQYKSKNILFTREIYVPLMQVHMTRIKTERHTITMYRYIDICSSNKRFRCEFNIYTHAVSILSVLASWIKSFSESKMAATAQPKWVSA